MTPAELDRCATVAAILKPRWPLASLKTYLTKFSSENPHRTYADTLHAIVAIALDPKTDTPARLAESGPWWHAAPGAEPERKITVGQDVKRCTTGCGRTYSEPESEHDCAPRADPGSSARALAREAAAKAAGEYERVMGEREARQDA